MDGGSPFGAWTMAAVVDRVGRDLAPRRFGLGRSAARPAMLGRTVWLDRLAGHGVEILSARA